MLKGMNLLGVAAGLAVGMAASYAISGDEALLRRNLKKMEKCVGKTLRKAEKLLG